MRLKGLSPRALDLFGPLFSFPLSLSSGLYVVTTQEEVQIRRFSWQGASMAPLGTIPLQDQDQWLCGNCRCCYFCRATEQAHPGTGQCLEPRVALCRVVSWWLALCVTDVVEQNERSFFFTPWCRQLGYGMGDYLVMALYHTHTHTWSCLGSSPTK